MVCEARRVPRGRWAAGARPGLVKKATTGLCGFHLSEEADLELQELVLFELERVLVNGDKRIELLQCIAVCLQRCCSVLRYGQ